MDEFLFLHKQEQKPPPFKLRKGGPPENSNQKLGHPAIWCAAYNNNLYMTSYRGRLWVEDIIRHPQVRLKIGDQLYDRTMTVVNDPAEKAAVLQAKGKKYPEWKVPPVEKSTVFRVNPL